ncbi:IS21 family transposase [Anseongella ginsenosidimutans]|uniref:IS21 family transposase n=1 Tax=Anseongella ginsenosidimutans TaxID=496056 RepID=UPI0011CB926B|nr:IS21 family transposase [Anseongella ginsenosidimutans]QEC53596.1 IS21 family transposase [Anseongella ginsenosidimutans]
MDKKTIHHWIMYHEIQKRHTSGESYSKIAADLGLDRRTVRRYTQMNEEAFEVFLLGQTERRKLLAPYEEFVRERLTTLPSASTAQVHDWLKEHHADFPSTIGPRTVYNFVMWVRGKHRIPCEEKVREYFPVEELPYGFQAQVDFGQCVLRQAGGGRQKVYFLALVLSRSRMKYLYFLDRAFTTEEAIDAHEAAFAYLGGMPMEIVYDQDRLFLVDERLGDLLLTQGFKQYVFEQQFGLYFCRKADPQSKGKVENVVGYVKKNFLYGRVYHDLPTLQIQGIAWLERTGNALTHGTTGKIPAEEWEIEKQHLKSWAPVSLLSDWVMGTVRKNNTFNFRGNVYSVPQGTYRGKNSYLKLRIGEGDALLVYTTAEELLCRHQIPQVTGM